MLKLVVNPARQGQVVNPVFSGAGFSGFHDRQDKSFIPALASERPAVYRKPTLKRTELQSSEP